MIEHTAERRRASNKKLLHKLMQVPGVSDPVEAGFKNLFDGTKDAVALGIGVALGSRTMPELLGGIASFTGHAQELLQTYPRVRTLYDRNLFVVDRVPRPDRRREVVLAHEHLGELATVTPDLPFDKARRITAVATAKAYVAAHGQHGTSTQTIDDRLGGAEGFTRLGLVLGRKAHWEKPFDLPKEFKNGTPTAEPPRTRTVASVLDDIDRLLEQSN